MEKLKAILNENWFEVEEGYLFIDDEKPKEGEKYWCKHKGKSIDVGNGILPQTTIISTYSKGRNLCKDCKKLIGSTFLIEGVPLIVLKEF